MSEPFEEPSPAEIRAAVIRMLYQTVLEGGKKRHVRIVCQHHPKFNPDRSKAGPLPQGTNAGGNYYHEAEVSFVDAAVINAAKELLDRTEGKPGTQKPAEPLPKFDLNNLEALTDEQLAALAGQEDDHGKTQGVDEERAA